MKSARLATIKLFALLFLLPGLAGLIVSAMISTHYLDFMPRWPVPEEHRIIPRGIHGTTVYQTPAENRELNIVEYTSVGVRRRTCSGSGVPGAMGSGTIARRGRGLRTCAPFDLQQFLSWCDRFDFERGRRLLQVAPTWMWRLSDAVTQELR